MRTRNWRPKLKGWQQVSEIPEAHLIVWNCAYTPSQTLLRSKLHPPTMKSTVKSPILRQRCAFLVLPWLHLINSCLANPIKISQAAKTLEPLRSGAPPISSEQLAQIYADWNKWRPDWVRRKKVFLTYVSGARTNLELR